MSTSMVPKKHSSKLSVLRKMEAAIPAALDTINIDDLTDHAWCDGVYRREFFLPKGAIVVSKIHQIENWFILFSGEVSISSAEGTVKRVKAPYIAKTEVGTKRAVYAHEDSVMYTFHGNPDNESDLEVLEARYIEPEPPVYLPPQEAFKLFKRNKP